jgi:hypothetical protein
MASLVVIGVGELGQLYAGGALREGLQVTPARRGDDLRAVLAQVPAGTPLLVAVGESALPDVASALPEDRKADAILIQNELFESRWRKHGLDGPTLAIPWVLKKKGLPVTVLRSTPLFGKHAGTMERIHAALGLPTECLPDRNALNAALVSKYAFILTINVLGVLEDRSVGEWLDGGGPQVRAVAGDAIQLAEAYAETPVDGALVLNEILEGMEGLRPFPARGRTAQARLERALKDATGFGLTLPELLGAAQS